MSPGRAAIDTLNRLLSAFNLRVDSLTQLRREAARIEEAAQRGDFDQPLYVLPPFESSDWHDLLRSTADYNERFLSFRDSRQNDVGYDFANGYFSSPDAEVLYTMVRTKRPARILEIGCGNSTKIIRQAIRDGGFPCYHECIDPYPRQEISDLADVVIRRRIETCDPAELASKLTAGDILFIDTSHEVAPANDVAYLYGRLLPRVTADVVVHIHDIFLPYEYPLRWVKELGLQWGEQYIVHAMLLGDQWRVLWPGRYLQRTLPDFDSHFPAIAGRAAQSLWIQRRH